MGMALICQFQYYFNICGLEFHFKPELALILDTKCLPKPIFHKVYKMGYISGTKRATEMIWILLERANLTLSNDRYSISVALSVPEI